MKQVAKCGCQVIVSGKIHTLSTGEVIEYGEKHPHLRPLEGDDAGEIDFATASEDELYEAAYELNDLKNYISNTYKITIRVRSKKKLVELLLDCKYRDLNEPDTD